MSVEVTEMVLFHHAIDAKDWPALVLEVEPQTPLDAEPFDLVHLQVFRPRGTEWIRTTEGTEPKQFSRKVSD